MHDQETRRCRRRGAVVLGIAAAGLPLAGGTAWAFFSAQATNVPATSYADTIGIADQPTATVSTTSVHLVWDAASTTSGRTVGDYGIKRYAAPTGGTAAAATLGSCAGTVSALACTETSVPDGTWYYSTTPVRALWVGTESPRSTGVFVTSDPIAPTVTSTTSTTANGTYAAGSPVQISVNFSETVNVTGTPTLTLNTGATASYVSGSGTDNLTFLYTVATGQNTGDLDYAETTSLKLSGGSIKDAANNNAVLTLPNPGAANSLGANKAIVIDTAGPSVTLNQGVGQNDPTKVGTANFTVAFSEPVTDFDVTDVTAGGTAGGLRNVTVTGSGTTYTVAVTGAAGDGTITASLAAGAAHDAVGNASAASTSTDNTVTLDTTAPTVTINQAAGQADPTTTSPMDFTVVFSEPVSGFTASDVNLGFAGGQAGFGRSVTGFGTTYNVSVRMDYGGGTFTLTVPAGGVLDAAGNSNVASTSTDNSVTFVGETVRPTATDIQAVNGGVPGTVDANDQLVFTFSEGMHPASIKAGWGGAATAVNINLVDGTGSDDDVVSFGANLGFVSMNRPQWVTANSTVSGTMSMNAARTVVTVTWTASPTNVGTGVDPSTLVWTPSTLATDLTGNAMTSATDSTVDQRF